MTLLDAAYQAHASGNKELAITEYERLLPLKDSGRLPFNFYQNLGSLYRHCNRKDDALNILKLGLKLFPTEVGISNNLANLYSDIGQHSKATAILSTILSSHPSYTDARISLWKEFRIQEKHRLAFKTIVEGFSFNPDQSQQLKLIVPLAESITTILSTEDIDFNAFQPIVDKILYLLSKINRPSNDYILCSMLLSQLYMQAPDPDLVLKWYRSASDELSALVKDDPNRKVQPDFQNQWHTLSWNISIFLLRRGRLKEGWSLYDHGLRVHAEGKQRWQRSLSKPFTYTDLPFPNNLSELTGKRLLLLGEQAIGDTMMFARLIEPLSDICSHISFFPGKRLEAIFIRSMPDVSILSVDDFASNKVSIDDFDYQLPIGSVPKIGFTSLDSYPRSSIFLSSTDRSSTLKANYLQHFNSRKPIVGISWQGGGKKGRIEKKSLSLKTLQPILSRTDVNFVSLQYGDDAPHLKKFFKQTGIHIFHDDNVDPLKDMDFWLDQVQAVDFVISIANTTIHGAGGLGKPTFCLLSTFADWRWIHPDVWKGCYWYPSVDVGYQKKFNEWDQVISECNQWLSKKLQTLA